MKKNLVSNRKLCEDNNVCGIFDETNVCIKDRGTNENIPVGEVKGGLY